LSAKERYAELEILTEPQLWVRGDARLVDGQYIELTNLATYDPYASYVATELLIALASVRSAEEAVAFATRYGLLFAGPQASEHRERFVDIHLVARALNFALVLHALRLADLDGDAEALPRLRSKIGLWRAMHPSAARDLDAWPDPRDQADIIAAEIATAALPRQRVVAASLLEQDDGHGRAVRVKTGNGRPFFLRAPVFENLVTLTHHMLGHVLCGTGGVELRVCAGCGLPFVPERHSQRHHDERCASRARKRRQRMRTS
jgi:hypothetical protein